VQRLERDDEAGGGLAIGGWYLHDAKIGSSKPGLE
jgi:hypothetical protein